MAFDPSDTSTHVICTKCMTCKKDSAESTLNSFACSKVCAPELLADMCTPGIDVIFEDGCPKCHPDIQFVITTTEPRHLMH